MAQLRNAIVHERIADDFVIAGKRMGSSTN